MKEAFVVVCEGCGRQRVGDEVTGVWVAPIFESGAVISHGCCNNCDEARYQAAGLPWPGSVSKREGA